MLRSEGGIEKILEDTHIVCCTQQVQSERRNLHSQGASMVFRADCVLCLSCSRGSEYKAQDM